MRKMLAALTMIGALSLIPDTASAADGCSYGPFGNIVCSPGARPGVPYGYGYNRGYRDYGRSYGRRGSLAYYCSLGSQTPRSLRNDCRRAGYW